MQGTEQAHIIFGLYYFDGEYRGKSYRRTKINFDWYFVR